MPAPAGPVVEHRPLGRTGVSKLCLGTIMFAAWGNTDHDDSIRVIHRALMPGSTSSPIAGAAGRPRGTVMADRLTRTASRLELTYALAGADFPLSRA